MSVNRIVLEATVHSIRQGIDRDNAVFASVSVVCSRQPVRKCGGLMTRPPFPGSECMSCYGVTW